jgi:ornithine cyclodeaminase
MEVLVLGPDELRRCLDMGECIEAMARALEALQRGESMQPLREAHWLPDRRGLVGVMPAHEGASGVPGIKVVTVFPGNHGTRYDAHQGVVLLFEGQHGCLRAILDGSEVTAIRTAAVSALATRLLAREGASTLALIGTGVQARTHLEALRLVRPIERVRVFSRDPERARRFAEREAERHGLPVEALASARAAVEDADIVCTLSSAKEPVLEGAWLASGAHVNAVGACLPTARELDAEAVMRCELFVDCRESAFHEAGDLLVPLEEGLITEAHVRGELGELLTGERPGRSSDEAVTLFESLGLGVEDVAAGEIAVARARELGLGTVVQLGGLVDA